MELHARGHAEAMQHLDAVAADSWLATNIKVCFSRESAHVQVLLGELTKQYRALHSGWTIFTAIVTSINAMNPRQQRAIEEQFWVAEFFTPGVAEVQTKLAATKLYKLFYMQPAHCYVRPAQII